MIKIEKSKLFLKYLVKARENLSNELITDDFLQHHNYTIKSKCEFLESVTLLGSSPIISNIIIELEREIGGYVFLKTVYVFIGNVKQDSYDIFRFESNKIAEHWIIFSPY